MTKLNDDITRLVHAVKSIGLKHIYDDGLNKIMCRLCSAKPVGLGDDVIHDENCPIRLANKIFYGTRDLGNSIQDVIYPDRVRAVMSPSDDCVDVEKLRILCDTVVRLAEVAQRRFPEICIENFAADCLSNILTVLKKYEGSK